MSQQQQSSSAVPPTQPSTNTVTQPSITNLTAGQAPSLVLRLRHEPEGPRVHWDSTVVDNEHMGRQKSNCCCIWVRPRRWDDDSSSDSECETPHCRGHTPVNAVDPNQTDPKPPSNKP